MSGLCSWEGFLVDKLLLIEVAASRLSCICLSYWGCSFFLFSFSLRSVQELTGALGCTVFKGPWVFCHKSDIDRAVLALLCGSGNKLLPTGKLAGLLGFWPWCQESGNSRDLTAGIPEKASDPSDILEWLISGLLLMSWKKILILVQSLNNYWTEYWWSRIILYIKYSLLIGLINVLLYSSGRKHTDQIR